MKSYQSLSWKNKIRTISWKWYSWLLSHTDGYVWIFFMHLLLYPLLISFVIYLSRQKWKKIKHVTFFTFLILIFARLYLDVTSLQCKYKSKHTHWFLKKAGEGNMQMESEEKKCKQINGLNMQWAVKRQRASPDCSGSAAIYKYHPRHYTSPLCTFRILTVGVMLVRGRHKNHFNCSVTELRPTAPTCQQTSKKERRKKNYLHISLCSDYADVHIAQPHITLWSSLTEDLLSRFTGAHVTNQTRGDCQTSRLKFWHPSDIFGVFSTDSYRFPSLFTHQNIWRARLSCSEIGGRLFWWLWSQSVTIVIGLAQISDAF